MLHNNQIRIIKEIDDYDIFDDKTMKKIIDLNWHTLLMQEKVDWISSKISKYT